MSGNKKETEKKPLTKEQTKQVSGGGVIKPIPVVPIPSQDGSQS